MDKKLDLVEQHILESAARLRHIDELMAKARALPVTHAAASGAVAQLGQIEADRDKAAQALEDLRRLPRDDSADVAHRGEGLKGMLATVGLQLEQVLAALFDDSKT